MKVPRLLSVEGEENIGETYLSPEEDSNHGPDPETSISSNQIPV